MKSQVNMTWNNVPCHCHHIKTFIFFPQIMESQMHFVRHAMKKNKTFFVDFVNKKVLTPFAMMHMFINCICVKYINTHPSKIEPKTLWKHIKVVTTKPLQELINKK